MHARPRLRRGGLRVLLPAPVHQPSEDRRVERAGRCRGGAGLPPVVRPRPRSISKISQISSPPQPPARLTLRLRRPPPSQGRQADPRGRASAQRRRSGAHRPRPVHQRRQGPRRHEHQADPARRPRSSSAGSTRLPGDRQQRGPQDPTQQWDLAEDFAGELEYQTDFTQFQAVSSLTSTSRPNQGDGATEVWFIGLRGEGTC